MGVRGGGDGWAFVPPSQNEVGANYKRKLGKKMGGKMKINKLLCQWNFTFLVKATSSLSRLKIRSVDSIGKLCSLNTQMAVSR